MGKRRARGRKKRKGFLYRHKKAWFLGLVVVLSVLSVSLFYMAAGKKAPPTLSTPERISKEVLEKRLKKLDSDLRKGLFSLGIKERGVRESILVTELGSQLFVTPYKQEFSIPEGLALERINGFLDKSLQDSGYKTVLSFEEKEDHIIGRVFLDEYPSHILYFYYPPKKPKGVIAIVIDDIGYNIKAARELIEMDVSITLSILPHLPYSIQVAEEARNKGRDVLLHLPMEPIDSKQNPGEGSLFTAMSSEEIKGIMNKDLKAVPYIIGVNNHMGSKFSEDEERMRVVLEEIREEGFFFLDSKTSKDSKGYSVAKEMGVKAIERDVFLDNERDVDYIKRQLVELSSIARKRGFAVAIGHPHPSTITAIREMLPAFKRDGIEVVPLSSLVDMHAHVDIKHRDIEDRKTRRHEK